MELNLKSMDAKAWRNVGLGTLAAGLLSYSAYRLYKYLANRKKDAADATGYDHKAFIPTYRKDHRARHKHHAN